MCGLAFAYQAQGQDTRAREAARSLLAWVQDQHNMGELMSTYAFQGQLALLQDRLEEAQHWLELAGEQETLGPMFFFEDPLIIRARMHIARGDGTNVARGQALLTHLLQHVEAIHSTRKTIKVLALQAWAYDVQGRGSEALALLERALVMGRPGGFIRTFAVFLPLRRCFTNCANPAKPARRATISWKAICNAFLRRCTPYLRKPAQRTNCYGKRASNR